MSSWIITKTDVDAYVTIALRWNESGLLADLPDDIARSLTVSAESSGWLLEDTDRDLFPCLARA